MLSEAFSSKFENRVKNVNIQENGKILNSVQNSLKNVNKRFPELNKNYMRKKMAKIF